MVGKARRLEAEAQKWLQQGQIRGGAGAPAPCTSLACPGGKGGQGGDNLEGYGQHGSIPAGVAREWRREFGAKGGFATPDGDLFDSAGSEVWGSRATNKGWDPTGRVEPHGSGGDWLRPERWVAQRKLSGRGAGERGVGEGPFSWSWPHGASRGSDMPWAAPYEWGDDGPDVGRLLSAVHERYDDPTHSAFLDRMYHKLRADELGPVARMHDAMEGLDLDASTALETVERAYAKPLA